MHEVFEKGEPAHAGHLKVDRDHIRPVDANLIPSLVGVGGRADNANIGCGIQPP
jgi:hypothetical protein